MRAKTSSIPKYKRYKHTNWKFSVDTYNLLCQHSLVCIRVSCNTTDTDRLRISEIIIMTFFQSMIDHMHCRVYELYSSGANVASQDSCEGACEWNKRALL